MREGRGHRGTRAQRGVQFEARRRRRAGRPAAIGSMKQLLPLRPTAPPTIYAASPNPWQSGRRWAGPRSRRRSLDDVVALRQHLQQGDLTERCRRHTLLLHLRVFRRACCQQAGWLPTGHGRAAPPRVPTSSRVFLSATSRPVFLSRALYTLPYVPSPTFSSFS